MNGATASTAVAYLADYRPNPTLADQLAIVTAERDQLRALYLADDHGQHAAMWRRLAVEGAVEARAEGWREGYEAGARSLEISWPAIAAAVEGPTTSELEARRYGDGGRGAFGAARPTDRTGAQLVADARTSWEAVGDLGPVDTVHLGGPAVHYRHSCGDPCRAYSPGWYSPADAARILRTLPGHYTATLADLDGQSAAYLPGRESQDGGA